VYPVCTVTPTDMDQKGAQGAFVAGQGSFNEADYATAILYWKDAYRRDCTAHALLLNLARAYELKGEKGEAIHALETYLERRPNDPNVDQIQRRIQNLKSQMAAEQAGPSAPPASPTPTATVGAGGVMSLVGVIVYVDGKKKISDVESVCTGRVCSASLPNSQAEQKKGNDAVHEANLGGVLTWTGAAAVAVGLVWHFAFDKPTRAPTPATAVTPVVGHGFAGAALDGRF
jgi:hypothetical protein